MLGYGLWTLWQVWALSGGEAFSLAIGGFAPPLGINFYVDPLAMLFVAAVQLMGLLFWPFKIDRETPRRQSLMLLLLAVCRGLGLFGGLFSFYVFWALVLVGSFCFLAALACGAVYVAPFFSVLLRGLGCVLCLVWLRLMCGDPGAFFLSAFAQLAPEQLNNPLGLAAFVAILIGVGVKAELFPVNSWVPEVYATAPARVSAILAGLVSKLAVLIVVRLLVLLFPQPEAAQVMLLLGMLGVISGELAAWRAQDLKRMLAYSSIGQLGMIFIAFSLPAGGGLYAGLALTLHHMLVKPGLFMLAERWGGSLQRLRGAGFVSPLGAGLFVLFSLSLVGMPPLPGFWAKLLLISGLAGQSEPLYMMALLVFLSATVVEASYLFRLAAALLQRSPEEVSKMAPLPERQGLLVSSLLAAGLISALVMIAPLAEGLKEVASEAGDVSGYVKHVFPSRGGAGQ
ncbi:NADH-quinone oxidoreductase subunit N [endosymbiont of Riftia pachyptila (vent Ph05)]|uniref:NADH-quinone oxidoreductase subunit N n=1 Tax=endosymbiont of Riftia pachyptila (vent Ph05) TaxID=1048808 RepID=G2DEX1_9GAMM|nr:NADH-quinone oxidoreductase subunit N [endosymbiont of Riftia pachyptila (vent Ph05)]